MDVKQKGGIRSVVKGIPGAQATLRFCLKNIVQPVHGLLFRTTGNANYRQSYYESALARALDGSYRSTDISDHLGSIFFHTLEANPKLIVELGTRGGESTRALISATAVTGATLLSVDLDPQPALGLDHKGKWKFVQADDVKFGAEGFPKWCADNGFPVEIDVLFIDTSHEYQHTKQEIAVWAPYVRPNGVILFHDTNMANTYGHLDGSIGYGWDNDRGVIRAIEEYMGRKYDEKTHFVDLHGGFIVKHYPFCNGFTVLRRFDPRKS